MTTVAVTEASVRVEEGQRKAARAVASVAVVCAALPTGSRGVVIAARYDILVARATAIIVVSTLLSVITLLALLSALAPAG